jgi:hypothetical protein
MHPTFHEVMALVCTKFGGEMNRRILNGWKEISEHLRRGVRTTQRWEAQLGMPVHRPAQKDRSAVIAFSDELDRWLARRVPATDPLAQMQGDINSLIWHAAELTSQTRTLREQLRRSLESHKNRTGSRIRQRTVAPATRTVGVMLPFPPTNQ